MARKVVRVAAGAFRERKVLWKRKPMPREPEATKPILPPHAAKPHRPAMDTKAAVIVLLPAFPVENRANAAMNARASVKAIAATVPTRRFPDPKTRAVPAVATAPRFHPCPNPNKNDAEFRIDVKNSDFCILIAAFKLWIYSPDSTRLNAPP